MYFLILSVLTSDLRSSPYPSQELCDYLMLRVRQEAMQDMMVACQELDAEDVQAMRNCGSRAPVEIVAPPSPHGQDDQSTTVTQDDLQAVKWAIGVNSDGVILDVAKRLPPAVLQEQVALWRDRERPKAPAKREKLLVCPHILKSRAQVAKDFHEHLLKKGWAPNTRIPRGYCRDYCKSFLMWPNRFPVGRRSTLVRRWHEAWLKNPRWSACDTRGRPYASCGLTTRGGARRKRAAGGGRNVKSPWLRRQLFEWWAGMRHAVDWKSIGAGCASSEKKKKIARFTGSMLKMAAMNMCSEYCAEHLKAGKKPEVPALRADWFKSWRREYGLSMKKPNRTWKCPRHVVKERLRIGWLNVARIRAAIAACFGGHDPSIENWDQSPFHHNESGSANVRTLAIAGAKVPMVEGHADTRKRWTANFTTCSDKQRLRAEGPPAMECVFKGGDTIKRDLEEHVRNCGYDPWVSVSTSEKGSYRLPDVLAFLDKHLPVRVPLSPRDVAAGDVEDSRHWRIIMADDHAPHLSPLVAKLCWNRGYIFIPHGGGVTPIAQTVDTDLNQEAKRRYIAEETHELLELMRAGTCVPQLRREKCVDIMVSVMRDMSLHLHAADGYLKTGFKASLYDGSLDHEICREAKEFWDELNMRAEILEAVEEVTDEFTSGRRKWNYKDVMSLIEPYPHRKDVDDVLRNLGETFGHESSSAIVEASSSDGEDGDGASDGDAAEAFEEELGAAEADSPADGDAPAPAPSEHGQTESKLEAFRHKVGAETAATIAGLQHEINIVDQALQMLKETGSLALAHVAEAEKHKLEKRVRVLAREDEGVVLALEAAREEEERQDHKRRRKVQEMNRTTKALLSMKKEVAAANTLLKKRQQQIEDAESVLHLRHEVRQYDLKEFGEGSRNCGLEKFKKKRFEVLERLRRVGRGLSKGQVSEFQWFKENWDEKMVSEHAAEWPRLFAEQMQAILNEQEKNPAIAVFSHFVHKETQRCFEHKALALTL